MRPEGGYGHNVGAVIDDYPDFEIHGETPTRPGYMARAKGVPRGQGAELRAATLDELAGQMDAARSHAGPAMSEYTEVELTREFCRRWILTFRPGSYHATHRRAYPPVNFEDATPEGLAGQLREWEGSGGTL